ncbi:glycine/betaine ABC transporter [Brachybacterium phenoliresistens]|uniref:Glycine/betaine ABC transporter n=1 Tax=Brachybacterium phenoliresistens TaxID=396014 RepID=Z9JV98_9MICO|nr:ABC transporter substrate-binding protein [Brachybacterium phenoliresistens]EWS81697.1 glycine/betaine ABC transporter [Brachybacterium phenoliresistens]
MIRRTARPIARRGALAALGAGGLASLAAACSSSDPLAEETSDASGGGGGASDAGGGAAGALVVGSQAYYSNEIIAELFAQVLEAAGLSITREYQIGQREVYLPELESGAVDLLPEYTGNLLQYYQADAPSASPEEIAEALAGVLPDGLTALPFAEATDQDSYTTTADFASANSLTAIPDLAGVQEDLKIAANSEFEARPYGPAGVKETYGVDVALVPVEDSGGPLTVKALTDGTVQLADIYTADPAIQKNGLVTLEDPESLILPQNVVPIASSKVDDAAAAEIAKVTGALTTEELIALNTRSIDEQAKSADIAREWLAEKGIVA